MGVQGGEQASSQAQDLNSYPGKAETHFPTSIWTSARAATLAAIMASAVAAT